MVRKPRLQCFGFWKLDSLLVKCDMSDEKVWRDREVPASLMSFKQSALGLQQAAGGQGHGHLGPASTPGAQEVRLGFFLWPSAAGTGKRQQFSPSVTPHARCAGPLTPAPHQVRQAPPSILVALPSI